MSDPSHSTASLRRLIAAALPASGLSEEQWNQLAKLDTLLVKWNQAIRLIGYRDDETRFRRYYLEALALERFISRDQTEPLLIDVGSGGGTPALPLAIARPDLQIVALEPNHRKAQFLKEAARVLHLDRLDVRPIRYEALPQMRPDFVSMRGLALEGRLEKRAREDLATGGTLLWVTSRSVAENPGLDPDVWVLDEPMPVADIEQSAWLVRARYQED